MAMIPNPHRCRKCNGEPAVQYMYRIEDDVELYRVRCEKCQNTGKNGADLQLGRFVLER